MLYMFESLIALQLMLLAILVCTDFDGLFPYRPKLSVSI